MNIAEFFQGVDGGNSSKRMIGIPCGLIGLGMHCYLFFFGLTHQIVSYSDLSGTANDLLKVSAILLGLGVVENFKITKGQMNPFGFISTILFAICALPEAVYAIKHKKCNLTYSALSLWFFGEIFGIVYAFQIDNIYLQSNYGFNLVCLLILIYYKFKNVTFKF